MAPMGVLGLLNPDGSPGPRAIHYYMERAKGGVGLIITGIFKVENAIEPLDGIVPRVSRTALGPFTELSEAVHALGAKIFVQLTIGLGRCAILFGFRFRRYRRRRFPAIGSRRSPAASFGPKRWNSS